MRSLRSVQGSARFGRTGSRVVTGQQAYTTPGTYSWVAPAGVTSVSVVAVGGGGGTTNRDHGGGGGGLGWKNNIAVTPGVSYTVFVGSGGQVAPCFFAGRTGTGGSSYFKCSSTVQGNGGDGGFGNTGGGGYVGTGGGNGGNGGYKCNGGGGGGGAGGYTGNGGNGGSCGANGGNGSGGGGGGGGSGITDWYTGGGYGAVGGGVGILGQGTSGTGGAAGQYTTCGYPCAPGSTTTYGAATAGTAGSGGSGQSYGGGGRAADALGDHIGGASGAVRIIWPGTKRTFPSTCTGNK